MQENSAAAGWSWGAGLSVKGSGVGNAPAPRGRRQSLRSIKQVKQVPKLKGENCHAGGGARQQWPEARRTPQHTLAHSLPGMHRSTRHAFANAPTGSPRSGRFKFLSNLAIQPLEKSSVLGREPALRHPLRQSTSRSPHAGHVHARCESPFSAPARALCESRQAPAPPGLHSALTACSAVARCGPPGTHPGESQVLRSPPRSSSAARHGPPCCNAAVRPAPRCGRHTCSSAGLLSPPTEPLHTLPERLSPPPQLLNTPGPPPGGQGSAARSCGGAASRAFRARSAPRRTAQRAQRRGGVCWVRAGQGQGPVGRPVESAQGRSVSEGVNTLASTRGVLKLSLRHSFFQPPHAQRAGAKHTPPWRYNPHSRTGKRCAALQRQLRCGISAVWEQRLNSDNPLTTTTTATHLGLNAGRVQEAQSQVGAGAHTPNYSGRQRPGQAANQTLPPLKRGGNPAQQAQRGHRRAKRTAQQALEAERYGAARLAPGQESLWACCLRTLARSHKRSGSASGCLPTPLYLSSPPAFPPAPAAHPPSLPLQDNVLSMLKTEYSAYPALFGRRSRAVG